MEREDMEPWKSQFGVSMGMVGKKTIKGSRVWCLMGVVWKKTRDLGFGVSIGLIGSRGDFNFGMMMMRRPELGMAWLDPVQDRVHSDSAHFFFFFLLGWFLKPCIYSLSSHFGKHLPKVKPHMFSSMSLIALSKWLVLLISAGLKKIIQYLTLLLINPMLSIVWAGYTFCTMPKILSLACEMGDDKD